MHLILSGLGSYGDVLPMVGIGATMRARGVRVQMMANPYFRDVIEHAGLELLAVGSAEDYVALMEHPDLWRPLPGLRLVLTRGLAAYLRPCYQHLEAAYIHGETVLAAHGLDLASRIFHEKHGAPLATVHFAPMALPTLYETPRYIGVPTVHVGPRWWRASQFWLGDRLVIGRTIGREVNGLRGELGLPRITRFYHRWNNSPQLVLGMFPDWFAVPQPDWPPQMRLVGFPLWDARIHAQSSPCLSDEVNEFLDAGDPPIIFAPGSANVQAREFFATAAEVCRRLRRRGMLMTKYPDQIAGKLPPGVRRFGFEPFSLLLPRGAALVHHGGIGTCAQGLASELPQLVMPMAYDQLDNAVRLERLGVGGYVLQKRFKPDRVTDVLRNLSSMPSANSRCRELAARCDGERSLSDACDQLELLHERRSDVGASGAAARIGQ